MSGLMRRRLLVLSVLLLGGVLLMSFDINRYRDAFVRRIEQSTQRDVRFSGDLAFSLWPHASLIVGPLSLRERGEDREFLGFAMARVRVGLIPLLSGKIVIEHVDIDGLRGNLVRFPDGRLNVDDLLAGKAAPDSRPLHIGGLALRRGELTWLDGVSGQTLQVRNLELHTGSLGEVADGRLALLGDFSGAPWHEPLSLRLDTAYRLEKSDSGALRLHVDAPRLALVGALQHGRRLALRAEARELSAERSGDPASASVRLSGLSVALETNIGAHVENNLLVRLQAPAFALAKGRVTGESLAIDTRFSRTGRSFSARVSMKEFGGTADALDVALCELRVAAESGGNHFVGELASPLRAELSSRVLALPSLSGAFTVAAPALFTSTLVLPVTAAVSLDFSRGRGALDLNARLDASHIAVKARGDVQATPALGFDVAVDRFDADRYLQPRNEGRGDGVQLPDGLSGRGAISIGVLRLAQMDFSRIRLGVTLKNGRVGLVTGLP